MNRSAAIQFSALCLSACLLSACALNEPDGSLTGRMAKAPAVSSSAARKAFYNAGTRFEYPALVTQLEGAVARTPDDLGARLALIHGYLKLGNYEIARAQVYEARRRRENFNRIGELWLDALEAKIDDDAAREIDAWRRVVAANPQDRWAYYELGAALSIVEDYAGAADAAASALSIEPDPAKWEATWIYYLQSKALARSGDYSSAVAAADAGRDNATTWRSTYFRKALAQVAAGDEPLADSFADDYRRVSTADGRNNESYTEANIALFFYELGDHERGVRHARRAYDLDPKGYQSWALSYNLTENGQAREALAIIDKAVEAFPNDPHVLAARGWTLYRMGRHEEARRMLVDAQANTARKIVYIDRMRKTIEAALDGGDSKARAPWLG